jgi:hypothetical protein
VSLTTSLHFPPLLSLSELQLAVSEEKRREEKRREAKRREEKRREEKRRWFACDDPQPGN